MTGVSVALGWWMAGRALAPLREITATARRVSGENLGERIALQGPDDELKELADTFDGMLMRLDSAFASQKHFVANASHELRTPLAIMRTEVDVALADPHASVARAAGDGRGRARDDRSQRVADRGAAVPRAQRGRARARGAGRPGGAGGRLHHRSASRSRGRRDHDHDDARTGGGARRLPRCSSACSRNLVENGIRHNQPGGELSVATSTVDGMAEVLVGNGGAVIDPAEVQSLTEPFRRLSRTAGGFGLGLSIVRSVARCTAARVELSAPPEGGLRGPRAGARGDRRARGSAWRPRSLTKS